MAKLKSPDSYFIQVDIEFANAHGLNESVLAGKMLRLQEKLTGIIDDNGTKWIRLTLAEWLEELPFMSAMTIRRTIEELESKNILLSTIFTGRSKWYRLNPENVEDDQQEVSVQNEHIHNVSVQNEQIGSDVSVQNEQLPRVSSLLDSFSEEGATPANIQTDADTFDDFIANPPKYTPVNGQSLGQRIKDNDPQLAMVALGVHAKDKAPPGQRKIQAANWRIYSDRIEIAMAAWLDVTHYEVPASKSERSKWLAGVKDHLEKFPADDLPNLYRLAWEEYRPAVLAGEIDITHPAALTNKMVAINTRPTPTATYNHDEDPSVKMSRGWMPEFRRKDEPQ